MKKLLQFMFLFSMIGFTTLSSCKKEDPSTIEPPKGNTPSSAQTYIPHRDGPYIALAAIRSIASITIPGTQSTYEVSTSSASAFYTINGGQTFKKLDKITLNNYELTLNQSTNTYNYIPNADSSNQLEINGNFPTLTWVYDGRVNSNLSPYTAHNYIGFPSIDSIRVEDVNANNELKVSALNVQYADSLLFGLYGTNDAVVKVLPGTQTSYTFSAADVNQVGKGSAMVQVTGLKTDATSSSPSSSGPIPILLINEESRIKMITIQ